MLESIRMAEIWLLLMAGTLSAGQTGAAATDAVSIPPRINYQGKLTDPAGVPLTGNYDFTFRIYAGGTQVWTETQAGVPVADGIFNVILGSVAPITSLPEAGNCSLEVVVSTEPIAPKIPLVSVPYSYHADNTAKLQGRSVSDAAPTTNQVLAWTGSQWAPANDIVGANFWTNSGSGYIYPNTPGNNTGVRVYQTGYAYNLYGATNSTYQYGVYGSNAAGYSSSFGVYGYNAASSAYAVYGYNSSSATYTAAVAGYTSANYGYGVYGYANNSSAYAVYGYNGYGGLGVLGTSSQGVYGYGSSYGVYGYGSNIYAYGVYGCAYQGYSYGVYGVNSNAYGYGVAGYNSYTGCSGIIGPTYYMLSRYIGVYGYSTGNYGSGLYGYSTGSYSYGVYGQSSGYYGYGVYGYSSASSTGYGVCGYNSYYASVGAFAGSYGVYGAGGSGGVYGYGWFTPGVYGVSLAGGGVVGRNLGYGNWGALGGYPPYGVYGASGSLVGVYGYGYTGVYGIGIASAGGYFQDATCYAYLAYSSYGILSNGTKSCVIATSQGDRAMFCPEAPEVLFEDAGSAQLVNGYCRVELDPLLLEGCTIDDKHPLRVFITPAGREPVAMSVVKGRTYFEVYGPAGSNVEFDWRILASRKGFEDKRLERVELASLKEPIAPKPAKQ